MHGISEIAEKLVANFSEFLQLLADEVYDSDSRGFHCSGGCGSVFDLLKYFFPVFLGPLSYFPTGLYHGLSCKAKKQLISSLSRAPLFIRTVLKVFSQKLSTSELSKSTSALVLADLPCRIAATL